MSNLNSNSENNQQQSSDDANNKQKRVENQKIGLIKCLINIEDWSNSLTLLEKLPQWYLASHEDISQSICKALRKIIDPIYQKFNSFSIELKRKYFNGNHVFDMITDDCLFKTFNEVALPILSSIGPGLSTDPILLTKIIRISSSFIQYVISPFDSHMITAIGNYLSKKDFLLLGLEKKNGKIQQLI